MKIYFVSCLFNSLRYFEKKIEELYEFILELPQDLIIHLGIILQVEW